MVTMLGPESAAFGVATRPGTRSGTPRDRYGAGQRTPYPR
jgi:hypothetical protein